MPLLPAQLFPRHQGFPGTRKTPGPHPWVGAQDQQRGHFPQPRQPRNHHPPQRPGGGGGSGQGKGRPGPRRAGGVRTRAHGQVPSRAAQCEERKGSQPPEPSALTTVVIGAGAALFPSGASLVVPKSEPRMLDKGHREPAPAQAKPCRGSSRYGLPTRAGAWREKAEHHRRTGNSQAQGRGRWAPATKAVLGNPPPPPSGSPAKRLAQGPTSLALSTLNGKGGIPGGLSRLKFSIAVSTNASPSYLSPRAAGRRAAPWSPGACVLTHSLGQVPSPVSAGGRA